MSNELRPGDLAIIIESVLGINVGKIVQCAKVVGEHSLYGIVWEVSCKEEIVTEYGGKGNKVHVPQKWLKKIKPGDLDEKDELTKLNKSDLVKDLLKSL